MFNIASATETSLLGLAENLLAAMGSELKPEFGPARAVNGVARRLADISAAESALGWSPEIDLRTGLRDLVQWWSVENAVADA